MEGFSKPSYKKSVNQIQKQEKYLENYFVQKRKEEFENKYSQLEAIFNENINKINDKLNNLSSVIKLADSSEQIKNLNTLIEEINYQIESHNKRIKNKEKALDAIKLIFWEK